MKKDKESDEGKTTKKGKPRKVGYLKMIVIDNLLSTIIDSDDSTSYVNLKNLLKEHSPKVISKKEVGIIPLGAYSYQQY